MSETTDQAGAPQRRGRRGRRPPRGQLLAMLAALAVGVLVGWALFGGDDGPTAERRAAPGVTGTASTTSTTSTTAAPVRVDVDRRAYPRFGVAFGRPKGWRSSIRSGILNASSGDTSMTVAISAAGDSGEARAVRASDRSELKRLFRAREVGRQRSSVGTAPTIVTEFVGRTKKDRQIRILSMAVSSRWRTYSVQVFTVLQTSPRRLLELRALLASVRFSQPR